MGKRTIQALLVAAMVAILTAQAVGGSAADGGSALAAAPVVRVAAPAITLPRPGAAPAEVAVDITAEQALRWSAWVSIVEYGPSDQVGRGFEIIPDSDHELLAAGTTSVRLGDTKLFSKPGPQTVDLTFKAVGSDAIVATTSVVIPFIGRLPKPRIRKTVRAHKLIVSGVDMTNVPDMRVALLYKERRRGHFRYIKSSRVLTGGQWTIRAAIPSVGWIVAQARSDYGRSSNSRTVRLHSAGSLKSGRALRLSGSQ